MTFARSMCVQGCAQRSRPESEPGLGMCGNSHSTLAECAWPPLHARGGLHSDWVGAVILKWDMQGKQALAGGRHMRMGQWCCVRL